MNSVEIVPIREEHIEGYHRALDFVSRERRFLAFLKAPPLEATRAFVRGNIARGDLQFVALAGIHDVIGWCDVVPLSRPSQAHRGVFGVGLLPAYRGRGIGKTLTRTAIEAGRAFGLHRIELTVRESNAIAIEVYRRSGFAVEGVQRDAIRIDNVYENVVSMALIL